MPHLNKFSSIKESILKEPSIKLKSINKDTLTEKNVSDFISAFFKYYNQNFDTIYSEDNKVQTIRDRRRTIDDIFRITYFYFPKVSLTKLYIKLSTLINDGVVVSSVCDVLKKRVYRTKIEYDKSAFFNGPLLDEYGVDFSLYNIERATRNLHGWGMNYTDNNLNIKKL